MKKSLYSWTVIALIAAGHGPAQAQTPARKLTPPSAIGKGPISEALLKMTGRRTKVIWTRGTRDQGGVLMCFDTNEGKERVVVTDPKVCISPCMTHDGDKILFMGPDQTTWVVDWNGRNLKQIYKGRHFYVMGTSWDPKTATEWVYAGDSMSREAPEEIKEKGISASEDSSLSIYRFNLKDPANRTLVWDKIPINRRGSISPDGAFLIGEFPWPNCGVAGLPNGNFKMFAQGCNANLAPDGSGMFFNLIGDHRNLNMYNKDGGRMGGNITVNSIPGCEKDPRQAVWRPRWSNNVRFFSLQSADLGPDADISLGEFDESFTSVKSWVRITDTSEYDAESLAWIEPEKGEMPKQGGVVIGNPDVAGALVSADDWLTSREGLIFLWRNGERLKFPAMALDRNGEQITAYAPIVRGSALYGPNYEMMLRGGSFVAHGVGESLSAAVTRAGMVTFEAYVRPPSVVSTSEVGRLVSYAGAGGTMFAVGQKGNTLMIGRRAANMTADKTGWVPLMTVPDAKPFHLVVSCDAKQITVYRDGQEAGRVPARMVAAVWSPGQLVFGSNWEGKESWGGRLEGMAFYNRAMPAEEAAGNAGKYRALVAARKPIESLRVKATLVARSESKTNIDPYFRALALFEYKVNKVLSGNYTGQKLYVSTWTVMQKKLLPAATRALQQEYELVVEPFTAHPELEPELQSDTLDRDFEIPVYYEVEKD